MIDKRQPLPESIDVDAIVRCKDCVHYRLENQQQEQPSRCTGVFVFVQPDPNGFCAWGKEQDK